MEWIKTISPFIGVVLGWFLSESGKIMTDKKQEKKKLKKLLFFLLELRYQFAKELSIENSFDQNIDSLKNIIADQFGVLRTDPSLDETLNTIKPNIKKRLLDSDNNDKKYEYLSENIDKVIIDLAEVFPILAYELNGQHKIKDRLNQFEGYFNEIESMDIAPFFDLKQFFNPKMTADLLRDLDESIVQVATQIGKGILKSSKDKIDLMKFDIDKDELEAAFSDFVSKIQQKAKNNPHS